MELTPREKDKLLLFTAALVAERRKARGLKLNYPESIAYISAAIIEGARDGRSVADLMSFGTTLLDTSDVMDGIAELVAEVQIEALFPDGTKLVTVHQPIGAAKKRPAQPAAADGGSAKTSAKIASKPVSKPAAKKPAKKTAKKAAPKKAAPKKAAKAKKKVKS